MVSPVSKGIRHYARLAKAIFALAILITILVIFNLTAIIDLYLVRHDALTTSQSQMLRIAIILTICLSGGTTFINLFSYATRVDGAWILKRCQSICLVILFCLSLSMMIAANVLPNHITGFSLPIAPSDMAFGTDGNLWFTEGATHKIGRMTMSGSITEFPLPTSKGEPWKIISGPDGALWFSEENESSIGRITTIGDVTEFQLPNSYYADKIISGLDGALWFSEFENKTNGLPIPKIGRMTTTGHITEFPLTIAPFDMTFGSDGNLWFTEDYEHKIGRMTMSGSITEFPLPSESEAVSITPGPDGSLWFTEYYGNSIGRITTKGIITEYPLPTQRGAPWGITIGSDNHLWFIESNSNNIGRITTTGIITEFHENIRLNGGIISGSDGNLWFAEYQSNNIWRMIP
jgi:virginiamycin B lyase